MQNPIINTDKHILVADPLHGCFIGYATNQPQTIVQIPMRIEDGQPDYDHERNCDFIFQSQQDLLSACFAENSFAKLPTIADSKNIVVFKPYISDGPGYQGDIVFELKDTKFSQQLFGPFYDKTGGKVTADLPFQVAEIIEVTDVGGDDKAELAKPFMDEAWLGYYHEYLPDWIKFIKFSDGTEGFILIGGEPCYVLFVYGDQACSFEIDAPSLPPDYDPDNIEKDDFVGRTSMTHYVLEQPFKA